MQGWANENIKEVLDCTILGYAANYTHGENTSHTQKILDQGKSVTERGKAQKRSKYSIPDKKEFKFFKKSATAASVMAVHLGLWTTVLLPWQTELQLHVWLKTNSQKRGNYCIIFPWTHRYKITYLKEKFLCTASQSHWESDYYSEYSLEIPSRTRLNRPYIQHKQKTYCFYIQHANKHPPDRRYACMYRNNERILSF